MAKAKAQVKRANRRNIPDEFWIERENEFATHALVKEFRTLRVLWSGLTNSYSFGVNGVEGEATESRIAQTLEAERIFKSLATLSAQALPAVSGREAWEVWLDWIRKYSPHFQSQNHTRSRYSNGGLQNVLTDGLKPVVPAVVDDKDGESIDFVSTTGRIESPFVVSQELCKKLRDRSVAHWEPDKPYSISALRSMREHMIEQAFISWSTAVPFEWILAAAKVDHKDGINWRTGKLSMNSKMSQKIEDVLTGPFPPTRPVGKPKKGQSSNLFDIYGVVEDDC